LSFEVLNRTITLLLALSLSLFVAAQNKKSVQQRKSQPTKAITSQKSTVRKPVAGKTTSQKATTSKKTTQKATTSKKKQSRPSPLTSPPSNIKGLQNQRQKLQQQIKEQEQRLRTNERNVKERLQNLMILNNEIADKKKSIDTIRRDINLLSGNIEQLNSELDSLQKQLEDRKQKYMKSMRYMHRNRSLQNQLMFIFSANNFSQMFRRQRFVHEYASFQRAQGEAVKMKQREVTQKHKELTVSKLKKNTLLLRGEQEHKTLEGKQTEQKQMVNTLQKEQKTIQAVIAEQKKKDAALNAQIDRLIAEEVARAKARAAEEAKRKAAEEAAKKRAEELARKKAAAEAARRENERRIAEAKAKEEKAKADARAAARKSAQEKAAAQRAARQAENERKAAEKRAREEARHHEKEVAAAKKSSEEIFTMSSEDRRLSGNFENNRGRLPMPITGPYRIVSHFGQNVVEGLKNVTLDNKGINIKGQPGAHARSIFDGEVSYVFGIGGAMAVMVRHGSYISIYCNLSSVNVSRGQHVSARQVLGTVGSNNILQFQLRREVSKLNPESWLGR
jgi:septal ring factor EnvC (AmiA/AmiB activator)